MAEAPVCSICMEVLKDPRVLPCGHSYCGPPEQCLKTLQQPDASVKCAICNALHVLDVDQLGPLYGIRDFLKEASEESTVKDATSFSNCDVHKSKKINYWCIQCSCKICQTCWESNHDGHSMTTYKKHLQKEVNDWLTYFGVEKKAFKNGIKKNIDYCQERIVCLKAQMQSFQEELDEMEKNKKAYEDLLENEWRLRAFSNDAHNADFKRVDSVLALMDKSSLSVAQLSRNFSMEASFQHLDDWNVFEEHFSKIVIVNDHKFQILARRGAGGFLRPTSLDLYLFCCPLQYETGWEYSVKKLSLCLRNSRDEKHDLVETFNETTFEENDDLRGLEFYEWDNLYKSDFLWNKDDKPFIRVRCTVE